MNKVKMQISAMLILIVMAVVHAGTDAELVEPISTYVKQVNKVVLDGNSIWKADLSSFANFISQAHAILGGTGKTADMRYSSNSLIIWPGAGV